MKGLTAVFKWMVMCKGHSNALDRSFITSVYQTSSNVYILNREIYINAGNFSNSML